MYTRSESGGNALDEQELFYRWRDERSPYIVELKLSLVPRLLADLLAAERIGLEAGGVLAGSFPRAVGLPTLRIEEYLLVGRRAGDGLPYIPLGEQRARFTAIRKRVATRDLSAVGYFRSHLRAGPFELTIADRDLLAAEFRNSVHVALLIARDQSDAAPGESPRNLATLFVSVKGIIQNRLDPLTFPFDVGELEKLNSVYGKLHMGVPAGRRLVTDARGSVPRPAMEAPASQGAAQVPAKSARRRRWPVAALAAFTVLCGLFVAWGWQRQGARLTGPLFFGPRDLDLAVTRESASSPGRVILHVDWNHRCPLLIDSSAGQLTVTNHQRRSVIRKLDLWPSELGAGRVEIELDDQPVDVSLALSMSDSTRIVQEARAVTAVTAR
jgi:hypothetical protein